MRREGQQAVGDILRVRSHPLHSALVALEGLAPAVQVGGVLVDVPLRQPDAELDRDEDRGQLSVQLFECVAMRAELATEAAPQGNCISQVPS